MTKEQPFTEQEPAEIAEHFTGLKGFVMKTCVDDQGRVLNPGDIFVIIPPTNRRELEDFRELVKIDAKRNAN